MPSRINAMNESARPRIGIKAKHPAKLAPREHRVLAPELESRQSNQVSAMLAFFRVLAPELESRQSLCASASARVSRVLAPELESRQSL